MAGGPGDLFYECRSNLIFTKWKIEQMRIGAEKARRDLSERDIRITTIVYVCDRKEDSLREGVAYAMNVHRFHQLLRIDMPAGHRVTHRVNDFVNITGTADEVCEYLGGLAEMGVTTIKCDMYGLVAPLQMMKRISEEVMPRFQG